MSTVKAGHEFRDHDGTLIATLTRDLNPGDVLWVSFFRLADGSTPLAGEDMHPAIVRELGLVASQNTPGTEPQTL
jgi:hypothetical protein